MGIDCDHATFHNNKTHVKIVICEFQNFENFLNLEKMGKKKNKKSNDTKEDLKKDVVTDPNLLKQELEVLIKNLNRERNLQEGFILKDDEVSDVDDAELSDDGDDEVKEEDETKKEEPEKEEKKSRKEKKKLKDEP